MRKISELWFSLFLGKWFYRLLATDIFLFVLAYFFPVVFYISQLLLLLIVAVFVLDYLILFLKRKPAKLNRIVPERLSNGDENLIQWEMKNYYPFRTQMRMIDEFPENWQIRDFKWDVKLEPDETKLLQYKIKPVERGEFYFGNRYIYVKSPLQLVVRKITFAGAESVKVYPGYLKLRQPEFLGHITDTRNAGTKQIRKTGHSLEFEQIREFVSGDDIRSINWKATGRTGGHLMINDYTDEKSQQIYCIVDKGRSMKMAFKGLSLMDYAVNATLVMSSIALTRHDRAGLISFGDKGGNFLPAQARSTQMTAITNELFNLQSSFPESDFSFLHRLIKTRINQRSLLVLFTNFESMTALKRQLPYFRNIAQKHLLLVVFFENSSLEKLASGVAKSVESLYEKVIAEKFVLEKKLIVKELQRLGIAALLTAPENLSVDVVNRYLQIKARREL